MMNVSFEIMRLCVQLLALALVLMPRIPLNLAATGYFLALTPLIVVPEIKEGWHSGNWWEVISFLSIYGLLTLAAFAIKIKQKNPRLIFK